MKVLLISGNKQVAGAMPVLPIGLACVAAATAQAGHEVRFLDLFRSSDWCVAARNAIQELHPDVIGLSVRNVDDQTMLNTQFLLPPLRDVVALCRSTCRAPIVLGCWLQYLS